MDIDFDAAAKKFAKDQGARRKKEEQKRAQLQRFFFTAVEHVAKGVPVDAPAVHYPRADEAHVRAFLQTMLRKYPAYDNPQGRPQVLSRYTAPDGDFMAVLSERGETILPLVKDYAGSVRPYAERAWGEEPSRRARRRGGGSRGLARVDSPAGDSTVE